MDQWIDVLSAAIGFGGVVLAMLHGQKQNQLRATIDLVLEQKRNKELSDARITYAAAKKADNLAKWASKDQASSPEAKAIMLILNEYEFIAAAMRNKAFNQALYKRMRYSVVVNDWDALKAFVHEKRQDLQRKTLFQEFEWMATKFKKKPLKNDHD